MILQDKINLFINRAQSKVCELTLYIAEDLNEAYKNVDTVVLTIELMDAVESLLDETLDWTDKELEFVVDYYTWKAHLNDVGLLVFDTIYSPIIIVDKSTTDNSWVPAYDSLSNTVNVNHQYTTNEVARLDDRINN